jgi:hypothetical protein
LKKLILFFGCLLLAIGVKAQYNYSEWGFGGGVSLTRPYSDLKQNDNGKSFNADIYYNYSPYLPFALEAQFGQLSGGNDVTDESHRFFKSNFVGLSLHGDVQLGGITDFENSYILQRLKGLYIGTGVGVMIDNITSIRRYAQNVPDYRFPGQDHSVTLLVPLRFGYEFKIFDAYDEPFMSINLGYVWRRHGRL